MLRRLAVITPAALLALGVLAAPASADICIKIEERIGEAIGIEFEISPPRPIPPYPNRVCIPMFVDPPVDIPPLPPISIPPGS